MKKEYEKKLRSAATAWFKEKGFQCHSSMSYCLNRWDNWKKNIILPEVVEYINDIKASCEKELRPFPLHKYVHHGLSSQAMLFNLIGPLVVFNDFEPLQKVISRQRIAWPGNDSLAQFEYEDRQVFNEDSGQPTSIDLVVTDTQGNQGLFIESKFVERGFGGCSVFSGGDCDGNNPLSNLAECYLHHIGHKYWELLKKHHFSEILGKETLCIFALHYQFFRELVFALEKGGKFILLSDERSPVFYNKMNDVDRGLMPLLMRYVPIRYKNRVGCITVQQMVEEIKGKKLLEGFRNIPANKQLVIDLLLKVSKIGEELISHIDQMDLNPIFVYENNICVVDAKLILK